MEAAAEDPNAELRLRQVFIKPDETLARDQIRTLNVLRGQAKCDSLDATDKFRAIIVEVLNTPDVVTVQNKVQKTRQKKPTRAKKLLAPDDTSIKVDGGIAPKIATMPTGAETVSAVNTVNTVGPVIPKNITPDVAFAAVLKHIAEKAQLTVNISPAVLKLVSDDGYLRSVFEVNKKGDSYIRSRFGFESVCFLKLYDTTTSFERPKYGAMNFLNLPGGVTTARSYGAWHLVLNDSVRRRCTLAPGDTFGVSTIGVLDFCTHVLCYLSKGELRDLIKVALGIIPHGTKYEGGYREIQIHGEVRCDRDFASINVPKGDANIQIAEEFSAKYGIPLVIYDP